MKDLIIFVLMACVLAVGFVFGYSTGRVENKEKTDYEEYCRMWDKYRINLI